MDGDLDPNHNFLNLQSKSLTLTRFLITLASPRTQERFLERVIRNYELVIIC